VISAAVLFVTSEIGRFFFNIFDLEAAESDFLRCDKDFFIVENEDDKVFVLRVVVVVAEVSKETIEVEDSDEERSGYKFMIFKKKN
jgi:hypothetical protein